jgi:DNA-binding beta-propeller fold protein YncE
VQKFSPEGAYLAGVGVQGDTAGTFARPKHIAVDSDGILYVVDAAFQNVQMFDDQLRLLMAFGAVGNFPGCMDLPAGVAVCDDSIGLFSGSIHPGFAAKRVVLVTNQFGDNKVSVYAMGGLAKGYTTSDLAKSSVEVSAGVGSDPEILKIQQALQNQGTVATPGTAAAAPAGTQPAPAQPATKAGKPAAAPAPVQASPR